MALSLCRAALRPSRVLVLRASRAASTSMRDTSRMKEDLPLDLMHKQAIVGSEIVKTLENQNIVTEVGTGLNKDAFIIQEGEVQNAYESWAADYEDDTDKIGFASPIACAKAAMNVTTQVGSRFLDVGCGTGLVGRLVSESRPDISFDGMDLSVQMMDVLQKKGASVYGTTTQHDISAMPWPIETKSYDVVVCNGVLIYVNKPEILSEFVRVTRRGGHCCIMFRGDGYPVFEEMDLQMRAVGQWRLVSQTEPALNFPDAPVDSASSGVTFSIHTYEVLV